MTDDTEGRRGRAAWEQRREAIAKRNAETRRRGQAERKLRDRDIDVRDRVLVAREADELHRLNARIAERRAGGHH